MEAQTDKDAERHKQNDSLKAREENGNSPNEGESEDEANEEELDENVNSG